MAKKKEIRDEILGDLGFSTIGDYEVSGEEEEVQEEPEVVEETPEDPEPVEDDPKEDEDPIETEDPEVEEVEEVEDPEEALLQRTRELVLGSEEPETDPAPQTSSGEVDSLKQQVALLTAAILDKTEKDVSSLTPEPEIPPVVEGLPKIDYRSPELIKVLTDAGVSEEEASTLLPIFAGIAEHIGDQKYGKKLAEIESRNQTLREEQAKTTQSNRAVSNLQTGLIAAKEQGGLEGKIVDEFLTLGKQGKRTLLSEHFRKFPVKLESAEGVFDAVVSVARSAQLVGAHSGETLVSGTKKAVTAALGKATNTVQSEEDDKPLSEEEKIKAEILSAGSQANKLPASFFG